MTEALARDRVGEDKKMKNGVCTALLVVIMFAGIRSSAQDMKPVSSTLAKSIAASGRKKVAVVDFTDLQGNVTELGRYLAEELSVDLVGDAKGYEVIERNQLKVILQEHRLSATGLIDPQTARKLGEFAGVDALVTGTITAFGDSVRLSAKVLDTQTARMIGAATSDIPKTKAIEELLGKGIGATQPANVSGSAGAGMNSPPNTGTGDSKIVVSVSAEADKLLFLLRACFRSKQKVICRGSVTDKSDGRIRVEFPYSARDSFLEDDLGTTYSLEAFTFGISGDGQDLEPELPIPFVLTAEDANQAARSINITLTYRPIDLKRNAYMSQGGKVGFRSIPIQQK